ncbi:putative GPI-anchored adhesin-like protein PGA55-like protein, partial [Dinothrombium tinctorium]
MLSAENVTCHYYCLLFACGLMQNGDDDEGILGFLVPDIQKEYRRGQRLRCRFCRELGATSACCVKKCRVTFHLPCGLRHNTLHQFFGNFLSFCEMHRPTQKANYRAIKDNADLKCSVCLESISPKKPYFNELLTPCCTKWLHRDCVQQQAFNAGSFFFKCPMCNNASKFINEMLIDASWELENDAFRDLAYQYSRCDAKLCLCPEGPTYDEQNSDWDIVVCEYCSSQGMHVKCGNIKSDELQTWTCDTCSIIKK